MDAKSGRSSIMRVGGK